MDRSTGKQVTTKARGNYVEVTLGGGIDDGSGRLLNDDMCFATITMSDAQLNQNIDELQKQGTGFYYGTTIDSGQVTYVSGRHIEENENLKEFVETWDPERLDYEVPMVLPFWEGLLSLGETDPNLLCNIFPHVVCSVGEAAELCDFFIICCGSIEDALFTTGNCCIQPTYAGHEDQDMRRLGKCSQ